jgi:hypothetical protein
MYEAADDENLSELTKELSRLNANNKLENAAEQLQDLNENEVPKCVKAEFMSENSTLAMMVVKATGSYLKKSKDKIMEPFSEVSHQQNLPLRDVNPT